MVSIIYFIVYDFVLFCKALWDDMWRGGKLVYIGLIDLIMTGFGTKVAQWSTIRNTLGDHIFGTLASKHIKQQVAKEENILYFCNICSVL